MDQMAAAAGSRPPFTAAQWQELEHQALIYKYMLAGVPVPPELLLPIRRSLEAARFFQHPSIGYCSLYGKKADPEPGRCRRTDGKKWRCSKDAYPDSKYCERHMHRGRNRSRKPVETHTLAQTAAVASLDLSSANIQSLPIHPAAANLPSSASSSYGTGSSDYRNPRGVKGDRDERSFFSESSGSARGVAADSSLDSSWRLVSSASSSFSPSKERDGCLWQSHYPHLEGLQDLSASDPAKQQHQQQQQCLFASEFALPEAARHDCQSLRPFFDEWPKSRDLWSDLEDETSNRSSFSTTQLSISIPMASPDFSATSSQSRSAGETEMTRGDDVEDIWSVGLLIRGRSWAASSRN